MLAGHNGPLLVSQFRFLRENLLASGLALALRLFAALARAEKSFIISVNLKLTSYSE